VANPKPAPDLFLQAAALLGIEPTRCVVFEDSEQGLEAARRAGMSAIDVNRLDLHEQQQLADECLSIRSVQAQ
jgi:beta-phosphoglucomutase-like phosphatase (HAD superfamily)